MEADIRLDGEALVLEGKWTRVQTWDLVLDGPGRRQSAEGERRALVHGSDDSLRVNFRRDYPNGVEIQGEVRLPDRVTIGREPAQVSEPAPSPPSWRDMFDFMGAFNSGTGIRDTLLNPPDLQGLLASQQAQLRVYKPAEFHNILRTGDLQLRDGEKYSSLKGTIAGLVRTVEALEQRVAELERRV